MIFIELKKFVDKIMGPKGWPEIIEAAAIGSSFHMPSQSYPDTDFYGLLKAIADKSGVARDDMLTQFGEFTIPDLLKTYGGVIKKEWSLMDLLERIEDTIHTVVRMRNKNATPPSLSIARIDEHTVKILYSSERKLCFFGKGLIRGLASHYRIPVRIIENTCQHRNDRCCEIVVAHAT